jgi:hypothetical protein
LKSSHVIVEHGGRDGSLIETLRKYINITTEMIKIFALCKMCPKMKLEKKGIV